MTRVSALAALLFASACSHAEAPALASLDEAKVPQTDDAPAPFGVLGVDDEEEDEEPLAAADDPNVISFEEDVDAGPTDNIAAPPKRKHIPSFELFGTAKTRGVDDDAPKMTLPDDVE